MDAHREAASVIGDGNGTVRVDHHVDIFAEARQGLVHGVIHDLIHEVVKTALIGGADIHAGAAADRFQTFQNLDITFVVMRFLSHLTTS